MLLTVINYHSVLAYMVTSKVSRPTSAKNPIVVNIDHHYDKKERGIFSQCLVNNTVNTFSCEDFEIRMYYIRSFASFS